MLWLSFGVLYALIYLTVGCSLGSLLCRTGGKRSGLGDQTLIWSFIVMIAKGYLRLADPCRLKKIYNLMNFPDDEYYYVRNTVTTFRGKCVMFIEHSALSIDVYIRLVCCLL